MQGKVRAEAAAVGGRELAPDDVPRLRYTIQVLHEALRLCPPGPLIPRLITRDIEVDSYLVKASTVCAVGVYALRLDGLGRSDQLLRARTACFKRTTAWCGHSDETDYTGRQVHVQMRMGWRARGRQASEK
jgi:hypothetical protein